MYAIRINGSWSYFDNLSEVVIFIKEKYCKYYENPVRYYTNTYRDEDDEWLEFYDNYSYSGICIGSSEKELQNNLKVLSMAYKKAERLDKDPVKFAFNNTLAKKLEGIDRANLFMFIEQLEDALKDIRQRKEALTNLLTQSNKLTTIKEIENFLKVWGGTGFDEEKNKTFVRYQIKEIKNAKQLREFIDARTEAAYDAGYKEGYDDF